MYIQGRRAGRKNLYVSGMLLLFSPSVVSDSLRPHGLQHTKLPCPHSLELAQTHVHRASDAINHLILCRPLILLPSF